MDLNATATTGSQQMGEGERGANREHSKRVRMRMNYERPTLMQLYYPD